MSNLRIPGFVQPWEADNGRPARIASALDIMLDGPIGAAAFNNEFGRPGILGYFRSFEQRVAGDDGAEVRGYHKPIMIAGGVGNVRRGHVEKKPVPAGAPLVLLGGPAMLIGLGGGAASSQGSGTGSEALDFASVQRGNPEMQRRAQQVIDACWAMGEGNPILMVHDVGAGGLSNAVPEVVAPGGGRIDIASVPTGEPGMSPLEIWCNEAQERYVVALDPAGLARFLEHCRRERCPHAVIGEAADDGRLQVDDSKTGERVVDMPIADLLGRPPRMQRSAARRPRRGDGFDAGEVDPREALERLLRLPAVADKGFLVTIGDRSVGGMISRDPLVGRWQVPVSDVAVTTSGLSGAAGEAMALGERPAIALLDAPASGRIAVGEAITNIAAADVRALGDVKLSANWMAACGDPGEDADLYDTVQAIGERLCPALGIAIPVGKDSLSMRTALARRGGRARGRRAALARGHGLRAGRRRAANAHARARRRRGSDGARPRRPRRRARPHRRFLPRAGLRPDRATCRPTSTTRRGSRRSSPRSASCATQGSCSPTTTGRTGDSRSRCSRWRSPAAPASTWISAPSRGPSARCSPRSSAPCCRCARRTSDASRRNSRGTGSPRSPGGSEPFAPAGASASPPAGRVLVDEDRRALHAAWSETTWRMQRLRDEPGCADEERDARLDAGDPGLAWRLTFDADQDIAAPYIASGRRPRVAILREQGVNSQVEMAAAFDRAGFTAVDVHMTDLIDRGAALDGYHGLVACGGFSYGDVLGAGEGWAKSILFNPRARGLFEGWFARTDRFTLGVCNGCQMLAALAELIPGTAHWPRFRRNRSEQFEGRLSMVEIADTNSLFFAGMAGSQLPIAVAHGEGRAEFASAAGEAAAHGLVTLRFVDNGGRVATRYPANPNGSPGGIAGLASSDGRVTILMPHPERVFRTVQNSWHPADAGEDSGWMRMFRNARRLGRLMRRVRRARRAAA